MNKNTYPRNKLIHLYNPKLEGLGMYDVNYINAYKKAKNKNNQLKKQDNKRFAA